MLVIFQFLAIGLAAPIDRMLVIIIQSWQSHIHHLDVTA